MSALVSVACSSSVPVWDDTTTDALSLLQLRTQKVDYPNYGIYANMEYPKEDTGGAPYCEGIVLSAKLAMEGLSQNVEVTKAACDRNDDCLGLKLNTHNRYWYPLHAVQPGGGSGDVWAANSGNRAQISVLVKNCDDALVLPTSSCGATEYAEGRVDNARISNTGFRSLSAAENRCDEDASCLGVWLQQSSATWYNFVPNYITPPNHRVFWRHHKGIDTGIDTNFASVRVKSCVTTTTTTTTTQAALDEAAAVGDPHMVLTSGQKVDLCCEGGKCEPCNSLHDSVTSGHSDENNDEHDRPRHPHHRR